MNRPLVIVALSLSAGILVASCCLPNGIWFFLALFAAGIFVGFGSGRITWLRGWGVVICFFAAGALLWSGKHAGPPGDPLSRSIAPRATNTSSWSVAGRVREISLQLPNRDYTRFVLDVTSAAIDGQTVLIEGGLLVRWAGRDETLYPGDTVTVRGPFTLALSNLNPGLQSPEDYYRRHGVHTAAEPRGASSVMLLHRGPWWSPGHQLARFRHALALRLEDAVPESVLPFVLAVWLGDRSGIAQDAYQRYVESGTAHILAVSGVHAGIVFMSISLVLRMLVHRTRLRAVLVMGAVLAFTVLAGAQITTVRAAVMICLYLAADLFDREPDAPTALSAAAILFLLFNPDQLFDIGFQLSFLSVASILLFSERIAGTLGDWWFPARAGAASSLSVQVLPLPLAVHYFHVMPLAAPLVNLLVIPLLTGVLWLCFLCSLSVWLAPPVAALFGYALVPLIGIIQSLAGFTAAQPWTHLYVPSPTAWALVAYYAAVAVILTRAAAHWRRGVFSRGVLGISLLILAGALWLPWHHDAEVVFLDVGHGDATYVCTPGGTTMLIDGGNRTRFTAKDGREIYYDIGQRVVAPFLWSRGHSGIDYAIASHADADHIGGLVYVVNHLRVGAVVLPPLESGRPLEDALLAACARRGVPILRPHRGDVLAANSATVEVLHPPASWPADSPVNDASLVLRVLWEDFSLLLPGDVELAAETELARQDCRASVLKAPHHGSRTSSSESFLTKVGARHVIVSTGGVHGREAVAPTVLARYLDLGLATHRTDLLGSIRLVNSAEHLVFEEERPRRGYSCVTSNQGTSGF